ncbi:glycosyltransferase [uncultured Bacteroides sp.]|uniref:glycosyltransferase n=1 Tax=uncultured Bacteroides sp. TaxID=162156 RepID=UPI002AA8D91A|nr:glycosyltransferase [uncultured Bacteroides sp.]
MQSKTPRILILSSCSLKQGPALIADQYYSALKEKGCDVDLLLKYPEPNREDIKYVLKKEGIGLFFYGIARKFLKFLCRRKPLKEGYFFSYDKENAPPVPVSMVLKNIKKTYDLVLVVFWQDMISFKTIDKIYDKLHCQIQFLGVDYSHMSGGCHFTNGCDNYMTGCGCCPAFESNDINDYTAWNVRYRKEVYDKVQPIVYGNLYMMDFYKRSYLLKNVRCELGTGSAIINTDVFKPLDPSLYRNTYHIPESKKHIIFFASQNLADKKKGVDYLLESFALLKKMVDSVNEILVLMAGKEYEKIKEKIPFDSYNLGYVPMDKLPQIFSIASFFVCPSVNDAGPMMVGQSLCCGTPVVGFDMGSVKELIKDRGTGICVPLKDTNGLAKAMYDMMHLDRDVYKKMSNNCRNNALQCCLYAAQADHIINIYNKYRKND